MAKPNFLPFGLAAFALVFSACQDGSESEIPGVLLFLDAETTSTGAPTTWAPTTTGPPPTSPATTTTAPAPSN